MKKLSLLFGLLATFLLTSTALQAQFGAGFEMQVSAMPISPCAGNPVTLTAVDTTGLTPPSSMQYVYWDLGDGSTASGASVNHTYATAGNYTVCAYMWDSLVGMDTTCIFLTVEPVCPPTDLFTGTIYKDLNGNGSQDAGEPPFPYVAMRVVQTGNLLSADASGNYAIDLPIGSWDLEVIIPVYYTGTQPTGGSYNMVSTGLSATTGGFDFGIQAIPGQQDVRVSLFSAPPVPGFSRTLYVDAYNQGTTTMSGTIVLTLDSRYNYTSSNPAGSHSSNVVTWNYSGLTPGTHVQFRANAIMDTSATVGDTACHSVTINPVTGDLTPANNVYDLCQLIVASYDPNDKQATPKGNGPLGEIAPGTPLRYRIRFQNTGTFMATNVFIRDTLDSDLDWGSFRVLGSSHPMNHVIDNNMIQFNFDGIMLPDSNSNEPASHGFVDYSINPKSTLAVGTEITNSASIYFDFNPPVLTNTTLNTIWVATSIEGPLVEQDVTLFPNPMQQTATLRFDAHGERWSLEVVDLQGRSIMQRTNVTDGEVRIERNEMAAGTYLYRLQSESGRFAAGKFIVQ